MTEPNSPEIVAPDGAPSPHIINTCSKAEALQDDAGDDPPDRLRGAQEAPENMSATIDPSIDQRPHGAGEAPVDAAQDGGPDGLSSSPNIARSGDVAGDDQEPSLDPLRFINTDPLPVRFPLPESNPIYPEMAENRHPDRESNQELWQTPATRSTSTIATLRSARSTLISIGRAASAETWLRPGHVGSFQSLSDIG